MKNLISLGIGIGILFLVFGCAEPLPEYKPKALESQSRGIATTQSTPYGCKSLGEIEGKDTTEGTRGTTTREVLREGAINDLKNNATEVITNSSKRIVLKIDKEEMVCKALFNGSGWKTFDCTKDEYIPLLPNINGWSLSLLSYRIRAGVFECGDK